MKDWSLNMTKASFDLQAALEKLHEEDWLHPEEKAFNDADDIIESEDDKKYQQKYYWVAQFSHILINQFDQSSRACSRILRQSDHKYIARAMKRFPESDFNNLSEIQAVLDTYCKEQGVK